MFTGLLIFIFATILSGLGVYALRYWLIRHQILDIPNERSSHTQSIPRGGGLLIVILTLLGLIVYDFRRPTISWQHLLAYMFGAMLLAGVSWLDDLRSVPVRIRLTVHGICALIAIFAFGYWQALTLPILNVVTVGWLGAPIMFVWIIGMTNAYNFMDGIDGLAGVQAVVAGLGWAILGGLSHQPFVMITGLMIAGSSLGFLTQNWPPARIFLGDVGSAYLGYTFAVMTILAAQNYPRLVFSSALLLWPFIFDAALTFILRLIRGEKVFHPHRQHLYQRLVISGYSHLAVTILYLMLAGVGVLLALCWYLEVSGSSTLIALTLVVLGSALFIVATYGKPIRNSSV